MEEKKAMQLSELTDAMYMYIKTGEKNKKLENFEKVYQNITDRFRKFLNTLPETERENTEDIIYLSCISLLGEIYEREEKVKQMQDEYNTVSKENPELVGILLYLAEKKASDIKQIQSDTGLSIETLDRVICNSSEYFNIREMKREQEYIVRISLKRKGKRFVDYLLEQKLSLH